MVYERHFPEPEDILTRLNGVGGVDGMREYLNDGSPPKQTCKTLYEESQSAHGVLDLATGFPYNVYDSDVSITR